MNLSLAANEKQLQLIQSIEAGPFDTETTELVYNVDLVAGELVITLNGEVQECFAPEEMLAEIKEAAVNFYK